MGNVEDAFNVAKNNLLSSRALYEIGQYRDSLTMSYFAIHSSALALLLKIGVSTNA